MSTKKRSGEDTHQGNEKKRTAGPGNTPGKEANAREEEIDLTNEVDEDLSLEMRMKILEAHFELIQAKNKKLEGRITRLEAKYVKSIDFFTAQESNIFDFDVRLSRLEGIDENSLNEEQDQQEDNKNEA